MCVFINHEICGFPMISHTFQRPGGPPTADAPNPQLAKLKPQRDGAMSFFARLIRQEDSGSQRNRDSVCLVMKSTIGKP